MELGEGGKGDEGIALRFKIYLLPSPQPLSRLPLSHVGTDTVQRLIYGRGAVPGISSGCIPLSPRDEFLHSSCMELGEGGKGDEGIALRFKIYLLPSPQPLSRLPLSHVVMNTVQRLLYGRGAAPGISSGFIPPFSQV